MPYLEHAGLAADRIGAGHAEGLFEAWANLYHRYAKAIEESRKPSDQRGPVARYPDVSAGLEGVRWVENCVRSADAGGIWVHYT